MPIGTPQRNPFEIVEDPAKEAADIAEIARLTRALLNMRYPTPEKILRGVHPKSHGCLRATFEVNPDLPEEYQVGVFSQPGKRFDARIRFSNAAVTVAPDLKDGKNGSRGMAIKLLDVGADVFQEDNGGRSQDFLMINTPFFAFANIADYLRLTQIILEHNDDPTLFFAPLQVSMPGFGAEDLKRIGRTFQIAQQIIPSKTVANPLEVQYFSAAPFAFGPDRVMKFSAEPVGGEKPQVLPENPSENYLREALQDTMSRPETIRFDFKIQVRHPGEADLGIEDATTEWDEETTPYVNVATISIPAPQTDLDSESGLEACENLAFTPWHAIREHQPYGSINRLRRPVYKASEVHRKFGVGLASAND